jgi:hypothetical protein
MSINIGTSLDSRSFGWKIVSDGGGQWLSLDMSFSGVSFAERLIDIFANGEVVSDFLTRKFAWQRHGHTHFARH